MDNNNLVKITVGSKTIESGVGLPTHSSLLGAEYTNVTTGIIYINKNGGNQWVPLLDALNYNPILNLTYLNLSGGSMSGSVIPVDSLYDLGGEGNSWSTLYVDNIIASNASTLSSLFVDDEANFYDNVNITGQTVMNGSLIANTISATTYYGDASNLTGLYWSSGTGTNSIIKLNSNAIASGTSAVSQGNTTNASGNFSNAKGFTTSALGLASTSEGYLTSAIGDYSHAEGNNSTAIGDYSHAEGYETVASGAASHAGGLSTSTYAENSFVHGNLNILLSGATNSAIIGGNNITGDTSNTTYVPILNIGTLGSGTSINNLGIDNNGNVVNVGSAVTDNYVTGATLTNDSIVIGRNDNANIFTISGDTNINFSEPTSQVFKINVSNLGEVNTASNIGGGVGLFSGKTSVDLEFKTLTSTGNSVTIIDNGSTVNLESSGGGGSGGNSSVDFYKYSFNSSTDKVDFFNDNNIKFSYDSNGGSLPDIEVYMLSFPPNSNFLKYSSILNGNQIQTGLLSQLNFRVDIYQNGITSGDRLEFIISPNDGGDYPTYKMTAFRTGSGSDHMVITIDVYK